MSPQEATNVLREMDAAALEAVQRIDDVADRLAITLYVVTLQTMCAQAAEALSQPINRIARLN